MIERPLTEWEREVFEEAAEFAALNLPDPRRLWFLVNARSSVLRGVESLTDAEALARFDRGETLIPVCGEDKLLATLNRAL